MNEREMQRARYRRQFTLHHPPHGNCEGINHKNLCPIVSGGQCYWSSLPWRSKCASMPLQTAIPDMYDAFCHPSERETQLPADETDALLAALNVPDRESACLELERSLPAARKAVQRQAVLQKANNATVKGAKLAGLGLLVAAAVGYAPEGRVPAPSATALALAPAPAELPPLPLPVTSVPPRNVTATRESEPTPAFGETIERKMHIGRNAAKLVRTADGELYVRKPGNWNERMARHVSDALLDLSPTVRQFLHVSPMINANGFDYFTYLPDTVSLDIILKELGWKDMKHWSDALTENQKEQLLYISLLDYLVGNGDRSHADNVLVEKDTGNLIAIDFDWASYKDLIDVGLDVGNVRASRHLRNIILHELDIEAIYNEVLKRTENQGWATAVALKIAAMQRVFPITGSWNAMVYRIKELFDESRRRFYNVVDSVIAEINWLRLPPDRIIRQTVNKLFRCSRRLTEYTTAGGHRAASLWDIRGEKPSINDYDWHYRKWELGCYYE